MTGLHGSHLINKLYQIIIFEQNSIMIFICTEKDIKLKLIKLKVKLKHVHTCHILIVIFTLLLLNTHHSLHANVTPHHQPQ